MSTSTVVTSSAEKNSAQKDVVVITPSKLDSHTAVAAVGSDGAGATSLFVGTTRDNFNGKAVVRLEYEAYEPMAVKEIRKLTRIARQRWDLIHTAVYHRTGVVAVREASIIIAVSSAHRKESLEAVHYLINAIKATVPIWKKEVYEDGTKWKANKESQVGSA